MLLIARVVTLAALCLACATGVPLAGGVRAEPLDVSPVTLPDVNHGGAPFSMRASAGGLLIVYFGYTSCPDVCPTTMSEVGRAIRALTAEQQARVAVAMATLDPDRDTVEQLTGYLGHFFTDGHALRETDPTALARAAAAFEVTWQVEEHAPGERYSIAHTAVTYVVDDRGTVVDEWPFGFSSELMTSDLSTLLARYDQ